MADVSTNRNDDLAARFAAARAEYSGKARQYKRAYRMLWWPMFLLTWALLFLRIGGPYWQQSESVLRLFEYLIAGSGVVFTGLTLANLVCGFREGWVDNRIAAERLRIAGLMYQFGIKPFGGPNADRELERELARVEDFVQRGFLRLFTIRVLPYFGLLRSSDAHDWQSHETPLGASVSPRYVQEDLATPEALEWLLGYINHQRSFHFNKARSAFRAFLCLQSLIIAVSLSVAALNFWEFDLWGGDPMLRVLLSAGLFGLGMMFVAIREQADLPPEFQRYYHVALDLDEAVANFRKEQGEFANLGNLERRQKLAAEATRILDNELHYWHAQAGRGPKDWPDEPARN